MRQLLRRTWSLLCHRRFEAELIEELEFHRDMKERELEAGGLEPTAATRATRRALGSTALAQDRSRDVWCPMWLQGLGQDLRLAVRTLVGTRIVSTVAILSLALGIGANTAIFSLVNSLLLRPLPVKDPSRLVLVTDVEGSGLRSGWSYAVWDQLRQRSLPFDGLLAWGRSPLNLAPGGETQRVAGLWVSGSFFETLGVRAVIGRTLSDADDQRGGGADGPVAILTYSFWQRHYGGARDVIGHTLTLDHVLFTIVGVTPPAFIGVTVGDAVDVVVPLGVEPLLHTGESYFERPSALWLGIMARLKPGQTITAATAALQSARPLIRAATLPVDFPKEALDHYLEAFALVPAATATRDVRGRYERPLLTLMIIVALVLLIACANIANLLLARASARRHELSVRRAIGASRWRLARQLVTESSVLAGAGAGLGLLLASWGSRLLVRQISTTTSPVVLDLSLDGRVLAFTTGIAVVTALVSGVAPAVRMSEVAPMDALKGHGRGAAGDAHGGLAGAFVVAQVALSVVLIVAAGLFVRTLASLTSRPLGFAPDRVLLVTVDAPRGTVPPAQRVPVYERTRQAVRGLPGVTEAALSTVTPLSGFYWAGRIAVFDGMAVAHPDPTDFVNFISPGWFSTYGTPLVAGRDFVDRDRKGESPVAVVNEAFARKFISGASPIGHTFVLTLGAVRRPPTQVVGVAADAVCCSLRDRVSPTVYLPHLGFGVVQAIRMSVAG